VTWFSPERLYAAGISCDIDHVTVSDEKLAGVDQALAELGKSDEEVSEVRSRLASAGPIDLQALDAELSSLGEGISVEIASLAAQPAPVELPEASEQDWEHENTEVEILDESDFVLLVDENELEELESAADEHDLEAPPPTLPGDGEEGEGFFKKLFGSRRSSNRP
jgi:hypothetical protein